MDTAAIVSRVLHVLGAIFLLGGAVFTRYAFFPAADALPEDQQGELRETARRRWAPFVHGGITVLVLTGLYNYLIVMAPQHKGDGPYHMLMGIKILLAVAVFFFGSALVGRSSRFEGIRRHAKKWLSVTVMLGVFIVIIAGILKIRGTVEVPLDETAPANGEPLAASADPGI